VNRTCEFVTICTKNVSSFVYMLLPQVKCLAFAGRAWLYHTLTEGSLLSYLYCLCRDVNILHRHYMTQALLRDTPHTQRLFTLLAGLEQVQFNLDLVSTSLYVCFLPLLTLYPFYELVDEKFPVVYVCAHPNIHPPGFPSLNSHCPMLSLLVLYQSLLFFP
jgi:hypothetical protein